MDAVIDRMRGRTGQQFIGNALHVNMSIARHRLRCIA